MALYQGSGQHKSTVSTRVSGGHCSVPASQGLLLWLETSAAPRRRPPRSRDLGRVTSVNEEVRRVADKCLVELFSSWEAVRGQSPQAKGRVVALLVLKCPVASRKCSLVIDLLRIASMETSRTQNRHLVLRRPDAQYREPAGTCFRDDSNSALETSRTPSTTPMLREADREMMISPTAWLAPRLSGTPLTVGGPNTVMWLTMRRS